MPMRIYTSDAWQRLRDAFDLKGKHDLLLDEIIVPVALVANIAQDLPKIPVDATFSLQVAADVAGNGKAIVQNDSVGSRFLVDRITFSANTTGRFNIQLTNTAATNAIAGGSADKTWNNRLQTPDVPGAMFADHGTFTGPDIWSGIVLGGTARQYLVKAVLEPGESILVSGVGTNEIFDAVFNVRVVGIAR